ncbi:MAG: hypothetical protein NTV52_23815 [Acidobacteria bacterium]|nr:hypothetical protein [Acidobacteriota bacterium]
MKQTVAILLPLLAVSCSAPVKPGPAATPQPPKITHFYPTANPIPRGTAATLCYGTDNATEVALAPYDDSLKPSLNRCLSVTPTRLTEYTLTAKGPGGQVQQTIKVDIGTPQPTPASAAVLITNFTIIGSSKVAPGTRVQFCYSTRPEAVSVAVTPFARVPLRPGNNQCFVAPIPQTTTLILNALDRNGNADRMQVTVSVAQ